MSNCILPNRSVDKQVPETNKDSTRTELAACAARFFAERGYHGTSTQAIAQHCNIRKASLFHHYKTKEDVALAAIQHVQKECVNQIFVHADDTHVEPKQRVANFLKACEQFFTHRSDSLMPTLLGLELSDEKIFKDPIEAYFQAWTDALTRLLLPLCANTSAAEKLAEESLRCIQGYIVTARIQQNKQSIVALSNELRQMWAVD